MSWKLQREEILDGDQLRAMLASNPARAAQAIVAAAGQNLIEAQALLGQILLDGKGIERDPGLALKWFGIAASRGHLMARNMLGRCHEHGWGCTANPSVAAGHYRLAATEGLACYAQAARMGHAKSMNLLGRYLEEGRYCEADRELAFDWYRRSAEAGDFRGQFSHAAVLAEHGHVKQAVTWLNIAREAGNLNFLRVSRKALLASDIPQIRALAAEYHRRAAVIGDESDKAEYNSLLSARVG
jgi:TPR repeat protein